MKNENRPANVELTGNVKALIITLLFRLLFGGYVIGMDQYLFNDMDSAITVLIIYLILGIFTTLFLLGKRYGLIGIIGVEAIFLVLNILFIILTVSQITDAGLHDPLENWWATLLRLLFSIMTLTISIKIYRENIFQT